MLSKVTTAMCRLMIIPKTRLRCSEETMCVVKSFSYAFIAVLYIHTAWWVCVYTCMCMCVCVRMCVCVCVHAGVHMYVYMCPSTYR